MQRCVKGKNVGEKLKVYTHIMSHNNNNTVHCELYHADMEVDLRL